MRVMRDGGVFVVGLVAMIFANLVLVSVHSASDRAAPPPAPAPVVAAVPPPVPADPPEPDATLILGCGEYVSPETLVPLLPRCWN